MAGILKHSDALKFIKGGNSTFTFLNTQTGNRFTYSVKVLKKTIDSENPLFYVKVLTSPDLYQYIGYVTSDKFKHSHKSNISESCQSVKVFNYVFNKLVKGTLDEFIEIWHEGKCGKCGRKLTVPESIETGFGPECIKMMMNKQLSRQIKINNILKSI